MDTEGYLAISLLYRVIYLEGFSSVFRLKGKSYQFLIKSITILTKQAVDFSENVAETGTYHQFP